MAIVVQGWGGGWILFRKPNAVVVVADRVNEVLWCVCRFRGGDDADFADVGVELWLTM